jgi:hypothetical protein
MFVSHTLTHTHPQQKKQQAVEKKEQEAKKEEEATKKQQEAKNTHTHSHADPAFSCHTLTHTLMHTYPQQKKEATRKPATIHVTILPLLLSCRLQKEARQKEEATRARLLKELVAVGIPKALCALTIELAISTPEARMQLVAKQQREKKQQEEQAKEKLHTHSHASPAF